MRAFLVLFAFLALILPAHAQRATVVASCGAAPTLTPNAQTNWLMDTTGRVCMGTSGGGGGTTSVWSAADAAANGMTLSNGGLTVTPSGAGSWQTIRNSIGKSSGKLYAEFKGVAPLSASTEIFGLASSSANIASYLGGSTVSVGLYNAGSQGERRVHLKLRNSNAYSSS